MGVVAFAESLLVIPKVINILNNLDPGRELWVWCLRVYFGFDTLS